MRSEFACALLLIVAGIVVTPTAGQRRIVPVDYDASIVSTTGARCPTTTASQMTKDAIVSNVRGIIRDNVVSALQCGLGECQENPGLSCNQIYSTNPASPSGWYWVQTCGDINPVVQVYCTMGNPCGCSGSAGGWHRIAYLNMSDPNQMCPHEMDTITDPVRSCDKRIDNRGDCAHAQYDSYGIPFTRVCGRIVGYQISSPDAFRPYFENRDWTIEEPYADGVLLSYGFSPRKHIWTFANGVDDTTANTYSCPCTGRGDFEGVVPSFIGNDYFCETGSHALWQAGRFYNEDPLWDGQGCTGASTCCSFNSPPWFCKQLSAATSENVELRLCQDQHEGDENTALSLYEIYVQ